MDKFENNELVEPMDAIVLLNDDYEDMGLKKGYIGTVMDNHIRTYGVVIADFTNPASGESIQPAISIKKEDFRVVSGAKSDSLLVKKFKDLFRKR